jgi:glycosyltransferase involved in cell wall biosynthesis
MVKRENPRSHKVRVLFIYRNMTEFIRRDIELLKTDYEVVPLPFENKYDLPRLLFGVIRSKVNISRFALGYARFAVIFSKLFRKKSIVIASGYDVATIPEFGYGIMLIPKRVKETKFALKHADVVTSESDSLRTDVNKYVKRDVHVIYQGFDSEKFSPEGKKEDMVITVGGVKKENLKRKGLEYFVLAAKELPHIQFVVIGKFQDNSVDHLKSISTPNVKFTGYIDETELIDYYRKAKVYVQISAHEGFGCSLAEAMLCECVPVVTDKGAIPEVVGDCGFYVPYKDVKAATLAIKEAMISKKGKDARERIKNQFTTEKRKEGLSRIINDLVKR